jgi:hypothetical protein
VLYVKIEVKLTRKAIYILCSERLLSIYIWVYKS